MVNIFYHGDCLFVLKHDIATDSIDLIYLDPPFFTGKIQKGKWQPGAMEISFEDSKQYWAEKADVMREKAPMWLNHLALTRPDFASYLWYMMERLQECYKVLKKTGSIYLHCDWRASHYLRMVMDEVFGYENFMNELVWYYSGGGASRRRWARKHDTIFFYAKGSHWTFNVDAVRTPHKWTHGQLRADHSTRSYEKGKLPDDVWEHHSIMPWSQERVGYPTQKPEELLERIIQASSEEGQTVLDPFCGCGTTVIVASKMNREWIGIDIDTSARKPGSLPTAFQVIQNRSHSLFQSATYITRDLSEISEMDGQAFERWVNEFYHATKPSPDKGVDGITQDGIPIQSKVNQVKYNVLSQFVNDVKYHPKVPKPVKAIIAVSKAGFDDSARKLKFEVETKEGMQVRLETPETMLSLDALP